MSADLAYLDWCSAAQAMRSGELSPVEYVGACLERIAALDARLDAVLWLREEAARAEARAAERALRRGDAVGPLHGVPFGLKDIIDAAGMPTTAHSRVLQDNVAGTDAEVTARLRGAGGILIGKLATHEFALGGPSFDLPWPPARNPWRTDCMPGGSSSGSGAAVAAGFVPLALGTDTGGSVRNPATACGIVGMKASYGLVSRRGVLPLAFSLDHVGPLTRTVRENAAALQLLAGHDADDPGSARVTPADYTGRLEAGVAGLRIGVIRHFFERDLVASDAVRGGIDAALAVLSGLGADVEDVNTASLEAFDDCNRIILLSEGYAVHERTFQERPGDFGALTRRRLMAGGFLRAVDYVQATRRRRQLRESVQALLQRHDVLITASSMEPAFAIEDPDAAARLYPRQARAPFNVSGHPALSVPVGFTDDGLPLGMQVVGRDFDEATVYQVAAAYEAATDWHLRRPPIDDPRAGRASS